MTFLCCEDNILQRNLGRLLVLELDVTLLRLHSLVSTKPPVLKHGIRYKLSPPRENIPLIKHRDHSKIYLILCSWFHLTPRLLVIGIMVAIWSELSKSIQ